MSLRIYLTGRVCIEHGRSLLDERGFPGRQCRVAFAYLVCQRERPVPRDELAEVVWPGGTPPAWDTAVSALVSKMRRLLVTFAPADVCSISSNFGCYQLVSPHDAWIDVEAAAEAIHDAEGALRSGEPRRAWGANVAATIARRPFLPGAEGPWIDRQRARLQGLLLRALDCLSETWLVTGESALAVQAAEEGVALEPFRETGYQRLMRAHAAAGNRAEALRVYEQCRRLLADELGTDPSPQTEALHLELLRPS
jgi:DNA-binding SARP family transcriptional activator